MKSFTKNINIKTIKNMFTEENRTSLLGLLTIFIVLWIILYFIPELFASLFNTLLGNIILVTTSVLVLMYNIKYGITVSILFILLYRFSQLSKKEGFAWSPQSTRDFILIQSTINPQKIFDVNMIQATQAGQEEVDYFNKNKVWPWSQKTKDLYVEALNKNPYIRTWPEDGLKYAMSVYNEAAILRVLSYQTKEGQFLLNGIMIHDPCGNPMEDLPNGFGDFPYGAGLMENKSDDVIKCNSTNTSLERITYTGKGGIFGEQTSKVTPVDYNELETIVPGFQFINAKCNPCGGIDANPDYSCPFKLNVKGDDKTSSVWQYLWK